MTRIAYLDCVGGLAGDMLLAALIDAGGDAERIRRLPRALGLEQVELVLERVERQGAGALHVRFRGAEEHGDHRSWRDIRSLLDGAALSPGTLARAIEAFSLLAEAEGKVHGVPPDEVHFMSSGQPTRSSTSAARPS
jgi:uncharacterized protein (DUF111 family)